MTLPDGAQFSNNFISSPGLVDGLNGTLFRVAIPQLDEFGRPIMKKDSETGEMLPTYADVKYHLVPDEPIAGEATKIILQGVIDIGVGAALTKIADNISGGGCKGPSCPSSGVQVLNVNENFVHGEASVKSVCGTAGCGGAFSPAP